MSRAPDINRILSASEHIDPVFLASPLLHGSELDRLLGCTLLSKLETRNPIGSFKGRGTELFAATELAAGEPVVTASAGNFGQGLARAAARRGHPCIVFAASTANPLKVEAMRRLGAEVVLEGADFDAAKAAARAFARDTGRRLVVDGEEPAIAEGAGTIAVELAAEAEFDTLVVPLGNGALLAGVGTALRHLRPGVEIVAVVADKAPSMKLSLAARRPVETDTADTIADGIAVRVPIPQILPQLAPCHDAVVSVSDDDILRAMELARRHLDELVEPAGAAGLAAILADPARYRGRRVATILCGANVSPDLLARLGWQ